MRDHPLYTHRWKLLLLLAAILIALWLYPTDTGREAPVETAPPSAAAPGGTPAGAERREAPQTAQELATARQTLRDLDLALGAIEGQGIELRP